MATRFALAGRIVTMDDAGTMLPDGVIYVEDNRIAAIRDNQDPAPDGFDGSPRIDTHGTIYPGLIELHNHLCYNILPLMTVTRRYEHRGQWKSAHDKRKYISGPLALLVRHPGYSEAVVRYTECKCLVAGVTTSQGITLSSAPGIEKKFAGVVRNIEQTGDESLPNATPRIADVRDATAFRETLHREKTSYFLHLSEGLTVPGGSTVALQQFLNLRLPDDSWAINGNLVGIHATGLRPEDFAIFAAQAEGAEQHPGRAAIVWSPLSNLLLYGGTTDVKAARDEGIRITLGSDWSPTGSKNLLGELKVAKVYAVTNDIPFTNEDLIKMATIDAARALKWDDELGSLEPGKRADLLVVAGTNEGHYEQLIRATEADIELVVIDGNPRYGRASMMDDLGIAGEAWTLGGVERRFNLSSPDDVPALENLSLAEATEQLRAGLQQPKDPPDIHAPVPIGAADIGGGPAWRLILDNDGVEERQHRSLAPLTTYEVISGYWAAALPYEEIVEPLPLDPLTVIEDSDDYFSRLEGQFNLPRTILDGLRPLYA